MGLIFLTMQSNGCIVNFGDKKLTCGDQEFQIKTIASTKERVACAVSNINIQTWGQIVYWINQESSDKILKKYLR